LNALFPSGGLKNNSLGNEFDMKRIYGARDSTEAEFVRSLLEAEEIQAVVQGSVLDAARGDIPFTQASLPSVWVNEVDLERATQIVDEFRRGGPAVTEPKASWTCPNCGEKLEGQFTTCWKCGTEMPITA
jgi:hypothetical protein